ncbi:hypothetical protein AGMMS49546_39890 [Spirochaetia bacterium]|nr:hypothetical protein AGMMS49546_39890 [Spirochaetia bacterium]
MYGLIFSKLFDDDIDSTYQYILEETKVILEDGVTIGGHGKAYDYMFSLIKKRDKTMDKIIK